MVRNINEMFKAVLFDPNIALPENAKWGAALEIEPYPDEDNCFDPRIGWFTQIVKANLYKENEMAVVGFLSEPLDR